MSLHFLRSMSANKFTSKFRTSLPPLMYFLRFQCHFREDINPMYVLRKLIIFCCPINFVYYEACTVAPCLSVTVKINSNLWPYVSISVKTFNAYHDNLCLKCWKHIFFSMINSVHLNQKGQILTYTVRLWQAHLVETAYLASKAVEGLGTI